MLKINRIALLFCILSLTLQSSHAAAPAPVPQDGGKKLDREEFGNRLLQTLTTVMKKQGHANPAVLRAPNGNAWIAPDSRSFADPSAPWLVAPPAHLLSASQPQPSQHSAAQAQGAQASYKSTTNSKPPVAGFRNLSGLSKLVPSASAKPPTPHAAQGTQVSTGAASAPQAQKKA